MSFFSTGDHVMMCEEQNEMESRGLNFCSSPLIDVLCMVAHCSHSNKLQNMNKLTIIFTRKKYRNETIMKKK